MRKLFLSTLFAILSILKCDAQFYSGGIGYSPKPCTESDSIIIYDTLTVDASIAGTRSVNFNVVKDSIHIIERFLPNCILVGDVEMYRQINLGQLKKGKYYLTVKGLYIDTLCYQASDSFINSLYLSFEVFSSPNSITVTTLPLVNTNSIIRDKLQFDKLPIGSYLKIYDIQGRLLFFLKSTENLLIVNSSDWQSGIYIITVESNSELVRWKVLKE